MMAGGRRVKVGSYRIPVDEIVGGSRRPSSSDDIVRRARGHYRGVASTKVEPPRVDEEVRRLPRSAASPSGLGGPRRSFLPPPMGREDDDDE